MGRRVMHVYGQYYHFYFMISSTLTTAAATTTTTTTTITCTTSTVTSRTKYLNYISLDSLNSSIAEDQCTPNAVLQTTDDMPSS